LLKLTYLDSGERAFVHAHCWAPWLEKQRESEALKKYWCVCAICGLVGPVDAPDETYCLQHRAQSALNAAE
jgi:hypothetical protein